ncbi:cellulose synthase interactive 1-like protein [Tanacetum coccineum]
MKVVAICAIQNLVMYNRLNKRAVAKADWVQVVLDLIGSSDIDASVRAAMFIKLLFSNNTIQEYAFSETVRAITVNEEYLKALNALFGNFLHLRASELATLSIMHLETSLSEATQEAALDALFFLRQAWSAYRADISRSQSNAVQMQYHLPHGRPDATEKCSFASLYDQPADNAGGPASDAGDVVMARWIQSACLQHLASPVAANNRNDQRHMPNLLMPFRANRGKGFTRSELVSRLETLEVPYELSPHLNDFVRILTGLQSVIQDRLLKEGLCSVHDESASLVVSIVDP